jgi:hypothetical protein
MPLEQRPNTELQTLAANPGEDSLLLYATSDIPVRQERRDSDSFLYNTDGELSTVKQGAWHPFTNSHGYTVSQ